MALSTGTLLLRLLGVLLCMVTARSAAMAFNRLVDARIDAANPRTADRHLPAQTPTGVQVWSFWLANVLLFEISCLLFLPNWLPLLFSVPVLAWICGYSFAKRFTSGAHLWLGIALALSPVCAWIALRGELVAQQPSDLLPSLLLGAAIACWVAGFDIIYACQDADFDRQSGLHSVPARFGVAGALRISAAFHVAMLLFLGLFPVACPQFEFGWLALAGLIGVSALVLRQHWLVKPNDLRHVGFAFFQLNAILSFGFNACIALDIWL